MRKGALTALAAAGVAALPLSAAAADTSGSLPQGHATGAAATVTVSLQPLKMINVNGVTVDSVLSQISGLYQTLCSTLQPTVKQSCLLQVPSSLPDSLQVAVAQSQAAGSLVQDTTDVVSGTSSSTPLYTSWDVLNADISALETAVTNLVNGCTNQLASGNMSLSCTQGTLPTSGLLTVNALNLEGTVSAALNETGQADKIYDSASAVSVSGTKGSMVDGLDVSVDPFTAAAVSSKNLSDPVLQGTGVNTPQVSASNTLTHVGLPALNVVTGNASLTSLASTVKNLATTLLNAIAAYQQGGLSALDGALSGTPLAGLGSTLGATLPTGTVTGTVTGTATSVDLTPLSNLATTLTTLADQLTGLNAAIAGLPDVTNLVYTADALSTAKLAQYQGGGVEALSTSNIGSLDVLPIGSQLAGVVSTALNALSSANVPGINTNIDGKTPLLSVGGVSSSADAFIKSDGSGDEIGTGNVQLISVLGQQLPIDANKLLGSAGTEQQFVLSLPALGSVTLDITRGVAQKVNDTALSREVRMATLDVRLINGDVCTTNCTTLGASSLPSTGTSTKANAATTSSSGGIAALGPDGSTAADLAFGDTDSAVSIGPSTGTPPCTTNCNPSLINGHTTTLPSTGMFGGGALPAGLVLIAVAISLRLVPSLRFRLSRVR